MWESLRARWHRNDPDPPAWEPGPPRRRRPEGVTARAWARYRGRTCSGCGAPSKAGRCRRCANPRLVYTPTASEAYREAVYARGDRTIKLRKVYERAAGRCALCGLEVEPRFGDRDGRAPSIDHVVPIAHGGEHTWSNVQLAHIGCNV